MVAEESSPVPLILGEIIAAITMNDTKTTREIAR
jgi:hypothetical protein